MTIILIAAVGLYLLISGWLLFRELEFLETEAHWTTEVALAPAAVFWNIVMFAVLLLMFLIVVIRQKTTI